MTFLENIGRLEISTSKSFIDTISFAVKVLVRMFQPHTYNSAMPYGAGKPDLFYFRTNFARLSLLYQ